MKKDTWENLSIYLQDELRRMRKHSLPVEFAIGGRDFETYLRAIYACAARSHAGAESAVLHFIEHGSWPEMDALTSHFAELRLLCGAELAGLLQTAGQTLLPSPSGTDRGELLCWLSIAVWDASFDSWLKLHAVSLYFSLPFFGL